MKEISFKYQNKAPCGVCHNKTHEGYITVAHMKQHQCLEKECKYFQKIKDHSYWTQIERERLEKKARKALGKRRPLMKRQDIYNAIKKLDIIELRRYVESERENGVII